MRSHDKFYEMESLELILYVLVGLFLILGPFFKRAKDVKKVMDAEILPDTEGDMPSPATSWEDLMRELKRSTELKESHSVRVDEPVPEPPISTKVATASPTASTKPLQTNLSTEAKKPRPTIENPQDDNFLDDLNDVDDLRRAIIYTEILNRKEY